MIFITYPTYNQDKVDFTLVIIIKLQELFIIYYYYYSIIDY